MLHLSRKQRLTAIIAISSLFFVAELIVGFWTRSIAVIADAFHYFNDIIGLVVALAAHLVSEREDHPPLLSYGWHRASTLGAFFNGVFLLALGLSIALQSIERFITIQEVEHPLVVLIVGAIGLGLNLISILFVHEHNHHSGHSHGHGDDHADVELMHGLESGHTVVIGPVTGDAEEDISPSHHHTEHKHTSIRSAKAGRDLGMLGVLIHVISDAINNIGVIVAAAIIWKATGAERFYADPAVSLFISFMILLSSWPLVKHSGYILLQGAPGSVRLADIQHDLEKIPGIDSVHELHVWRLDQLKSIASAHVVISDRSMATFMDMAKTIRECLHAYGIHSATLQPELVGSDKSVRHGATGEVTVGGINMTAKRLIAVAGSKSRTDEAVGTKAGLGADAGSDTGSGAAEPRVDAVQKTQSWTRPQVIEESASSAAAGSEANATAAKKRAAGTNKCQFVCGSVCQKLTCCTKSKG